LKIDFEKIFFKFFRKKKNIYDFLSTNNFLS